MLKKLLTLFKSIEEKSNILFAKKIESFHDPLAKEVEWNSISQIRFGYKNRKLVKTKAGNIIFIPSTTAMIFPLPFIALGLYVMWKFSVFQPPIENIIHHPYQYSTALFLSTAQTVFFGYDLGSSFWFSLSITWSNCTLLFFQTNKIQ
jgi:hypothetical protein